MKPDIKDVMAVAGTASIGWGLWQIWPPLAFVVVGGILLGVAVAGARGGKE